MDIAACIVYLVFVVLVIGWLIFEIRVDKRDQIKPAMPGPQERLPPKSDC